MEDDELELDLSVILAGIDNIRDYTAALKDMAKALGQVRKAASAAADAQAQYESSSSRVNNSFGGNATPPPGSSGGDSPGTPRKPSDPKEPTGRRPSGLNARLRQAQKEFEEAKKSGDAERIEDAGFSLKRAQENLNKARNPMSKDMHALYSMRLNLPGGAAPLLGKTLEAAVGPAATRGILAGLAPMVRTLGPMGVAFMVAKDAVVGFYQAAQQSAELTNRLTASRASSGGSIADVARLGLMGGSSEAARAFQERITSDPMAMNAAGRVGVRNQKSAYGGNLNFSAQYLAAIENTAKIADESQRQRLALTLGIEQEVAKYSLLSEETRKRLKEQAAATAAISDPRAQAQAAEFEAAQKQMSQAWGNVTAAFGNLFSDDVTGVLNELADGANALAKWLHGLRGNNRRYKTPLGALTGGLMGDPGYDAPGASGQSSRQTPLMANTLAMQANTEALARLNGTIGGGARTQEALPSALRGQQLHQAMMTGQLRLGALG